WPSRDPIAEDGGVNLYGMVGNDGVNRFDILGLCDSCGKSEKECCGGKPKPKRGRSRYVCCGNKWRSKTGGKKCCGEGILGQMYSTHTHCCKDGMLAKKIPNWQFKGYKRRKDCIRAARSAPGGTGDIDDAGKFVGATAGAATGKWHIILRGGNVRGGRAPSLGGTLGRGLLGMGAWIGGREIGANIGCDVLRCPLIK
ncbi:hypothetical protein, partial [Roseibacillus ishigakijimensis]